MLLIKYTSAGVATYDSELGPDTGRDGCVDHYMVFDTEESLTDFYADDPEAFLNPPKVLAELSEREVAELFCQMRWAMDRYNVERERTQLASEATALAESEANRYADGYPD